MSDKIPYKQCMIKDPELLRAVKEYYDWQGDHDASIVKFIVNLDDYEMLVVRFTDSKGHKLSGLMDTQNWADGHWDVTERNTFKRECEDTVCAFFENTSTYEFEED